MPITLKGQSLNAFGEGNANEQIRFTSLRSELGIHSGASAVIATNSEGFYLTPLREGIFSIESLQKGSREWVHLGDVLVNEKTDPMLDIPELLLKFSYKPPEPK